MYSSLVCIFEQSCQFVYLSADPHGVAVGACPPLGTSFGDVANSSQHKCDLWPVFWFGFLRDGGFVSGSLLIGSYFSVNRGAH